MSLEVLGITRPENRIYLALKYSSYWNLLNHIFIRHQFFQGSSLYSS